MPLEPTAKRNKKKGGIKSAARHPAVWVGLLLACLAGGGAYAATGCSGWDPSEPFERNSPDVDRALELYDSGQFESAEEVLEEYLGTGPCQEGKIGLGKVRDKHSGAFDLGLVLFQLAEKYGRRFGQEEAETPEAPEDQELDQKRTLEIDCALFIALAIAHDVKVAVDLRARAFYLAGNLEFLRREYQEAVKHYDAALQLIPGLFPEAGDDLDGIGRDAAWNRAIALRRIEEQDAGADGGEEDAEADAEPDSGEEDGGDAGGEDDGGDGGEDEDGGEGDGADAGDAGGVDSGDDDGGEQGGDAGEDQEDPGESGGDDPEEQDDPNQPDDEELAPPDQSDRSQRDRVLDELEEAPTYQEEESKQNANRGRRRVMEDK